MIRLNEAQRAAVMAEGGPALVLAGAGTGKTRVIIERMAWLVEERGVDPRQLLALTFTNRAANEMKERLAARLGSDPRSAWVGTFHSFGLFILRREMDKLGRPRAFTVFDDSDQLSLMKRLVKELPPDAEKVLPREALVWMSRLKQQVTAPDWNDKPKNPEEAVLRGLWRRYHAALAQSAAVDYDDLLSLVVQLFDAHPDVRDKYRRRFRHVLVDEYQDTNRAQYLLLRHLCGDDPDVFVVGDEDQAIYSWRGADIRNILDFAKDFPQAVVYRLEENYRSTEPILKAANALVAHNVNRLGKTLWTPRTDGDPVRFHLLENGDAEAEWVVSDFIKQQWDPKEVAILFRTNAQSRPIEEALRKRNIPYILVGGIKFYSRKEIKDILAYLRLLVNPADDESVRRILNVPPRGIGSATMERIEEYAAQRRMPLFQVLRDIETDTTLPPRARASAADFVRLIDDLAVQAKSAKVAALVITLLERIAYRDMVSRTDERDATSRLEIVAEFIEACRKHDTAGEGGLEGFLQGLALLSDVDNADWGRPAVTLLTCHSAKGLEFDYVYLIGLEEGLLPYGTDFSWEYPGDVEEERRLCYVAMTRARRALTLTAAQARTLYGRSSDDREVSRFIEEIGADRLQRIEKAKKDAENRKEAAEKSDAGRIRTGARVRHARFGLGTVLYTSGMDEKLKARIRFDTGRSATILVKAAPLEMLEGKRK